MLSVARLLIFLTHGADSLLKPTPVSPEWRFVGLRTHFSSVSMTRCPHSFSTCDWIAVKLRYLDRLLVASFDLIELRMLPRIQPMSALVELAWHLHSPGLQRRLDVPLPSEKNSALTILSASKPDLGPNLPHSARGQDEITACQRTVAEGVPHSIGGLCPTKYEADNQRVEQSFRDDAYGIPCPRRWTRLSGDTIGFCRHCRGRTGLRKRPWRLELL